MSEEKILEIIEKLQCEYKEQQNDKKYNDYTVFKAKEYSKGLQGLLDLYIYKKGRVEELKQELLEEKEKNKKIEHKIKGKIEWYQQYCDLDYQTVRALEDILE